MNIYTSHQMQIQQKAWFILALLVFCLGIFGCKNMDQSELNYDHSKVKIFATVDAPLEAIHFVLFEDNSFKVQVFNFTESENFDGIANIDKDSILLSYNDKTIDFKTAKIPIKMKINGNHLDAQFYKNTHQFTIRELVK